MDRKRDDGDALLVCLCVDGIYEKAEAKKQERESIVRFGSVSLNRLPLTLLGLCPKHAQLNDLCDNYSAVRLM